MTEQTTLAIDRLLAEHNAGLDRLAATIDRLSEAVEQTGEPRMTYSEALGRHINVPIEQLNRFDEAELDAAVAAIPGYPEIDPADIRVAADHGDINARLILSRAEAGDPVAKEWAGL